MMAVVWESPKPDSAVRHFVRNGTPICMDRTDSLCGARLCSGPYRLDGWSAPCPICRPTSPLPASAAREAIPAEVAALLPPPRFLSSRISARRWLSVGPVPTNRSSAPCWSISSPGVLLLNYHRPKDRPGYGAPSGAGGPLPGLGEREGPVLIGVPFPAGEACRRARASQPRVTSSPKLPQAVSRAIRASGDEPA